MNRLRIKMNRLLICIFLCSLYGIPSLFGLDIAQEFAQKVRDYDLVVLRGSRAVWEGVILNPSLAKDGKIYIQFRDRRGMTSLIEKDRVLKIIPKMTAEELYFKLRSQIKTAQQRLELAGVCFNRGLFLQALVELKVALAMDPKRKVAYRMASDIYARLYKNLGEGEEAKGAYRELAKEELLIYQLAERHKILDPVLYYRAAKIYDSLGLVAAADLYLKKSFAQGAENFPPSLLQRAYLLRGEVFLKQNKVEDALKYLEKVEEEELDFEEKYRLWMAKANASFQKGDFDQALANYNQVLELCRGNEKKGVDAWIAMGTIYYLRGTKQDLERAEELFYNALRYFEVDQTLENILKTVQILSNLSLVYTAEGKFRQSANFLKQAKTLLKKTHYRSMTILDLAEGFLILVQGKTLSGRKLSDPFRQAASYYRQAARESVDKKGFFYFLTAKTYLQSGDLSKAEEHFKLALRYNFSPLDSMLELAKIAYKRKKLNKAIRYLRYITQSKKIPPSLAGYSKADIYYFLGRVLLEKKNHLLAKAAFSSALSLDPVHQPSLNGMGYIYYTEARRQRSSQNRENLLQKAQTYLKKSLSVDPRDAYARRLLTNIQAVKALKVWTSRFEKFKRLSRFWQTDPQGMVIAIEQKRLVIRPPATEGKITGKTAKVWRQTERAKMVRWEVELDFSDFQGEEGLEGGIYLENASSNASGAVLRLFAKQNKVFYYVVEYARPGMLEPQEVATLPPHRRVRLAIVQTNPAQASFAFVVGDAQLANVEVLSFHRSSQLHLGIYVSQTSSKSRNWKLKVEKVRIFKKRS